MRDFLGDGKACIWYEMVMTHTLAQIYQCVSLKSKHVRVHNLDPFFLKKFLNKFEIEIKNLQIFVCLFDISLSLSLSP